MSVDYAETKTLAQALLEKALLDSSIEILRHFGCEIRPNQCSQPISSKGKTSLLRKSSVPSFEQLETHCTRYLSFTTATCVKPRGEVVDAKEEMPYNKVPCGCVLSLEKCSRCRKLTKLRNRPFRVSISAGTSVAGNANECFNWNAIDTLNEDFLSKGLVIEKSGETTLGSKESDSSSLFSRNFTTLDSKESYSSSAFSKNSRTLDSKESDSSSAFWKKLSEESDYCSATDSVISDWRDQFSYAESDSVVNVVQSTYEPKDSWSNFSCSGGSASSSLRPIYKCSLKPKDSPPAGMLFAGLINSKGNRFKTFHLDAKLQTVIDWLGTPLPISIQVPGSGGRRCTPDLTLAKALGKLLKSPSQQGIAFFTGPVNTKLSYLMTIVDLAILRAMEMTEDEKLEKLESWL